MKNVKIQTDKYTKLYVGLIFGIISIVYVSVILSGNMYMFLDIGSDTYCGQWPSLAYAKHVIKDFKLYDMEFGLGGSTFVVFSNLLDPFNWPCFFFSEKNLDIGIFIGTILRFFCLAYYAYRYLSIKGIKEYACVICSLMIVFCGWFVGWGQHYTIGTIFVFFLAELYYFERWMKEKKYIGLIASTALLAAVSVYFSYMIFLFLMFYYFMQLYFIKKEQGLAFKEIFVHSMKTGIIMLSGIGCAACIFLPNFESTSSSPRVSVSLKPSLHLASAEEYRSIFFRMFSNSILGINQEFVGYSNFYESPFVYIGILALLLIPLFIAHAKFRKKYWPAILITLFVFVFVDFSCIVFSALSAKVYRWTFVFVPVVVLACGKMLQDLDVKKYRYSIIVETILLDVALVAYFVWHEMNYSSHIIVLKSVLISFLFLNIYAALLIFMNRKKSYWRLLLIAVAFDLCMNAYISVHDRILISSKSKDGMGYFDASNEALDYLEGRDESFYRVSKNYNLIDLNDSLIQHYNGEKVYTSLLSGEMWDMINLFHLRIPYSNYFYGFDDKQILRNLTVGKYRFTKQPGEYHGYKMIHQAGDVYIYENENCAAFGTLYDQYTLRSSLVDKNQYDLQNILLESCILEDVEQDERMQTVLQSGDMQNIETQLVSEGKPSENNWVYLSTSTKEPLLLEIFGTNANGSIQLYTEGNGGTVINTIPFSVTGESELCYIDLLNVSALKILDNAGLMTGYKLSEIHGESLTKKAAALKERHMNVTEFSDMYISGNVTCDKNSILFFPLPYDKNWSIFINHQKTELYRADAGFMAIIVPEGTSEVELRYKSKYFQFGCMISILFILLIALVTCVLHFRKKGKIKTGGRRMKRMEERLGKKH